MGVGCNVTRYNDSSVGKVSLGENDTGKANDAATYSLAPRNVVQASDIMHVPGWGDSGVWVLTEGGEIKELEFTD